MICSVIRLLHYAEFVDQRASASANVPNPSGKWAECPDRLSSPRCNDGNDFLIDRQAASCQRKNIISDEATSEIPAWIGCPNYTSPEHWQGPKPDCRRSSSGPDRRQSGPGTISSQASSQTTSPESPTIEPCDVFSIGRRSVRSRFMKSRLLTLETICGNSTAVCRKRSSTTRLYGTSSILLVERHICIINPAAVARTERLEVSEGKTPKSRMLSRDSSWRLSTPTHELACGTGPSSAF